MVRFTQLTRADARLDPEICFRIGLIVSTGRTHGRGRTAIVDTDATTLQRLAGALAALFAAFPGTREDMLQRTLMRMHRVTFIGIGSLFRSAMPWDRAGSDMKHAHAMFTTPDRSRASRLLPGEEAQTSGVGVFSGWTSIPSACSLILIKQMD